MQGKDEIIEKFLAILNEIVQDQDPECPPSPQEAEPSSIEKCVDQEDTSEVDTGKLFTNEAKEGSEAQITQLRRTLSKLINLHFHMREKIDTLKTELQQQKLANFVASSKKSKKFGSVSMII